MSDTNVVYSFHYYYPSNYALQEGTSVPFPVGVHDRAARMSQYMLDWAKKYNAPVFMGEGGCAWYAPNAKQYLQDCITAYEEKGIGWSLYAFREDWDVCNYENNPGIVTMLKASFAAPAAGIAAPPAKALPVFQTKNTRQLSIYDVFGKMLWSSASGVAASRNSACNAYWMVSGQGGRRIVKTVVLAK
jgi:hypothetical protein